MKKIFNLVTILLFTIVILLTSCVREEMIYLSDEESRILEEMAFTLYDLNAKPFAQLINAYAQLERSGFAEFDENLLGHSYFAEISHDKYMDSAMPDGEIDFIVVQSINENMPPLLLYSYAVHVIKKRERYINNPVYNKCRCRQIMLCTTCAGAHYMVANAY